METLYPIGQTERTKHRRSLVRDRSHFKQYQIVNALITFIPTFFTINAKADSLELQVQNGDVREETSVDGFVSLQEGTSSSVTPVNAVLTSAAVGEASGNTVMGPPSTLELSSGTLKELVKIHGQVGTNHTFEALIKGEHVDQIETQTVGDEAFSAGGEQLIYHFTGNTKGDSESTYTFAGDLFAKMVTQSAETATGAGLGGISGREEGLLLLNAFGVIQREPPDKTSKYTFSINARGHEANGTNSYHIVAEVEDGSNKVAVFSAHSDGPALGEGLINALTGALLKMRGVYSVAGQPTQGEFQTSGTGTRKSVGTATTTYDR